MGFTFFPPVFSEWYLCTNTFALHDYVNVYTSIFHEVSSFDHKGSGKAPSVGIKIYITLFVVHKKATTYNIPCSFIPTPSMDTQCTPPSYWKPHIDTQN